MSGTKQEVYLYGGHLAKSGKTIIEFGGIKVAHVSKVADKSDLLVHLDSGIVIRAYPKKTDRSKVLDDLANNIDKLKRFIDCPEAYQLVQKEDLSLEETKAPQGVLAKLPAPFNLSYEDVEIDSSCVTGACASIVKKKFDMKDSSW